MIFYNHLYLEKAQICIFVVFLHIMLDIILSIIFLHNYNIKIWTIHFNIQNNYGNSIEKYDKYMKLKIYWKCGVWYIV
jgi:hypothetical protein